MNRRAYANESYLPVLSRAPEAGRTIAVTVDDCDNIGNLRRMIRLFDGYDAGLTLFPTGRALAAQGMGELVRHCVFDQGYEIENHTMNHKRIFRLPEIEMAEEIWRQGQELNRLLGVNYRQHFFRLMGGDGFKDLRTHNYLIQLGFRGIIQWSVCGTDLDMTGIRRRLRPGAICLFHTVDGDAEKLERFIPFALSRGYRLVTMNELLGLPVNETTPYQPQTMPLPRAYPEDYRPCRPDDYSWNVCRIQERLMAMGLLHIDGSIPTGYYGELTEAAVRRFQAQQGLPVTGTAYAATQKKLFALRD